MAETFSVEVCCANGERLSLLAQSGWTIRQVLVACGLMSSEWGGRRIGIYGKLKTLETPVRAGDRIEIYRPLLIDPNSARLLRAEKNRRAKAAAVSKKT